MIDCKKISGTILFTTVLLSSIVPSAYGAVREEKEETETHTVRIRVPLEKNGCSITISVSKEIDLLEEKQKVNLETSNGYNNLEGRKLIFLNSPFARQGHYEGIKFMGTRLSF